jgi:hypothetical protein
MQRLVVVALLSALLILAGCTGVCRHQYGTYDPRTMTVVVTNTGPTATQVKVTVKAYSCGGELLGIGIGYGHGINDGDTREIGITEGNLPKAPIYIVSEEWKPAIRI